MLAKGIPENQRTQRQRNEGNQERRPPVPRMAGAQIQRTLQVNHTMDDQDQAQNILQKGHQSNPAW